MSERFNCAECGFKCEPTGLPCDLCNDTLCGACCDFKAENQ